MKAIVLAAGVGKRFGKRTQVSPKCLIPLPGGSCLLNRYLDSFREVGIREVIIVVGHKAGMIRKACLKFGKGLNIRFIQNTRYRRGSLLSLYTASRYLSSQTIIMDADVFFPITALKKLLISKKSSAFLADPRSKSTGEEMMLRVKGGRILAISKKSVAGLRSIAEATGIVKLSTGDSKKLSKILADFVRAKNIDVEYEDAYIELLKQSKIGWIKINGFWSEMDFEKDWKVIARTLTTRR